MVAAGIVLSACDGESVYVLYRNSIVDKNMRIHVATFDASDGDAYNHENCDQAQKLFQAQPAAETKFWC
jgi:hypothetical protein